jgi:hypothetical protein
MNNSDLLPLANPGDLHDGSLQLELVSFVLNPVHKVPTYNF